MTPISGCPQYIFSVVKVDAILFYEPNQLFDDSFASPASQLTLQSAPTLSETEIPSDSPVKLSVSSYTAVL